MVHVIDMRSVNWPPSLEVCVWLTEVGSICQWKDQSNHVFSVLVTFGQRQYLARQHRTDQSCNLLQSSWQAVAQQYNILLL